MPPTPLRAHRTFAAESHSVVGARRFARELLQQWDAEELLDTVSLIVSELVTNAVVHAGTPVRVALRLHGPDLRVEVEDQHPGRAVPLVPERPSEREEHGRGLLITMTLSSSWGVEYTATSKRVWALCRRSEAGAGPGAAVVSHAEHDRAARVAVVELSHDGVVTGWSHDAESLFGWAAAEVVGHPFTELLDAPEECSLPGSEPGSPGAIRWQGTYGVTTRDGTGLEVFASHVALLDADGTVLLLVPAAQRSLLEQSATAPGSAPLSGPVPTEPVGLGLPPEALVTLSVEDYLTLAVEHIRDPVAADATYLLLAHDFDGDLEVAATSGLPESLRGTRLPSDAPGTPDQDSPHRPVVVPDVADHDVPLLAETGLRSLVVVPLVVEGRVVGALGAGACRIEGFTHDQAILLQRFADSIALAADRARLQASERERRDWLSFIADAGDLLAGSLDQDMTMAITGQVVVPRIAPWCAIHLNDQRGRPVLQQVWHEDETRADAVRSALRSTTPGPGSTVLGRSVTAIPLVARGRQIGVLTLARPWEEMRGSEFYLVAKSIARRAALAIDNARTHGHLQSVGRALQESLLPPSTPAPPGLDVGVVYEAAGEDTVAGGDFYDLFPLDDGRWCFVVGDVCGTGAEAAAVTGLARHTIQALARTGLPLAATLERLNTAILEEGERGRFLTLVCGTVKLDGSRVHLSMVNAGHPRPFLVDRDGAVREIGSPQPLLGVIDTVAYTTEQLVLSRGDLLVAVTDGVLERRDEAGMLGEEGLGAALATVAGLPAQGVAERVRRLAVEYTEAPQRDDMAILAIRMGAAPTPAQPADAAQPAVAAQDAGAPREPAG